MKPRIHATRTDAVRDASAVTSFLAKGHPLKGRNGAPSAIRLAGDSLGIDRATFRERIGSPERPGSHFQRYGLAPDWSIAAARGELGYEPVLPGYVVASTSTQRDGEGKVEREWIKQRRAPEPEPFQLPPGQRIKGVSALVDGQGRATQKWVKTEAAKMTPAEMVEAIREAFTDWGNRAEVAPPPPVTDDQTATVYGLADLHLGLLTWWRETGENWDLAIAQRVIGDSINRLVAAAPASREAVVLGLGDLLHANGYDNQTPQSKHPLDVDGRYPKILKAATFLMIAAVEAALAKHEHVTVRVLRGNHDKEPAIAVALGLALHYSAHARVTVDDDPGYFWWWRFGRVLLGATHGDRAKMADLPLIMAARNPEDWGATAFRYILTGHIHTRTAIEQSGVVVESLQTPIPPDAWHHESGYGATRSLTAITYHAEDGEISRAKVNIRPSRAVA